MTGLVSLHFLLSLFISECDWLVEMSIVYQQLGKSLSLLLFNLILQQSRTVNSNENILSIFSRFTPLADFRCFIAKNKKMSRNRWRHKLPFACWYWKWLLVICGGELSSSSQVLFHWLKFDELIQQTIQRKWPIDSDETCVHRYWLQLQKRNGRVARSAHSFRRWRDNFFFTPIGKQLTRLSGERKQFRWSSTKDLLKWKFCIWNIFTLSLRFASNLRRMKTCFHCGFIFFPLPVIAGFGHDLFVMANIPFCRRWTSLLGQIHFPFNLSARHFYHQQETFAS